jgi:predicted component of type VI protein secretion system
MRHSRLSFMALSLITATLTACSHNPHKAEKIETKIEKDDQVSGDTKVGVKDGNMVVQKKVLMNEELRRLQNEVYELEDHVYGNRKFGSQGLYGNLKTCRTQLADKANGGSGKLSWTEPMDRVSDKEDDLKIGLDEKEKLVGVSEEFLKDRIERFRNYKMVLQKRQDEYEDKVDICKNELRERKAATAKKRAGENDD